PPAAPGREPLRQLGEEGIVVALGQGQVDQRVIFERRDLEGQLLVVGRQLNRIEDARRQAISGLVGGAQRQRLLLHDLVDTGWILYNRIQSGVGIQLPK